ncbi:MAG: SgcJ/EcaC family oxidoreductase [Acidobacteriota bacterium]
MSAITTSQSHEQVRDLVARLEAAWNEADVEAFAAEFAPDADFVNIRGDYASGREAIAAGHAHIWSSIYAGSTVRYSIAHLRALTPSIVLVHLDAELLVPPGPAAGTTKAIPSLVIVRDEDRWQVAAFHNTQRRLEQTGGA